MTDAFAQLAQMTQVLEDVLAQRYYATGRGLQEKLSSVENELPDAARKQIRLVASFRDRAADGAGADRDLDAATRAFCSALIALDGAFPPGSELPSDLRAYGDRYLQPVKSLPAPKRRASGARSRPRAYPSSDTRSYARPKPNAEPQDGKKRAAAKSADAYGRARALARQSLQAGHANRFCCLNFLVTRLKALGLSSLSESSSGSSRSLSFCAYCSRPSFSKGARIRTNRPTARPCAGPRRRPPLRLARRRLKNNRSRLLLSAPNRRARPRLRAHAALSRYLSHGLVKIEKLC